MSDEKTQEVIEAEAMLENANANLRFALEMGCHKHADSMRFQVAVAEDRLDAARVAANS